MSDAIVKYQDRIPLPPGELLRFLKELLDDAAARGRTFVCHEPREAQLFTDDAGAVIGLRVVLVGPAGYEAYDIPAWAINDDIPRDEINTLGFQDSPIRSYLEEFCDDIEDAGGLIRHDDESVAPFAAPDWGDLALTYEYACRALGRKPKRDDEEAG